MESLEETVKAYGRELGFDIVGITTAEPFLRDEAAATERIRQGLMDGLPWYTEERVHKATHPGLLLSGARSIVSLAVSYHTGEPEGSGPGPAARVARYAWGDDYHGVLKRRLRRFVDGLQERIGRPVKARVFVDDGPMNDRAAAERAGVGWFGKNTNILTSSHGSWVVLGQVVTDLDLKPDAPLKKTCGECVRCIDDCPTGAIVAPYVVDNTRCISFLTIELRGPIPRELRPLVGDWVFGCDICQDVCPVNRKIDGGREPAFRQRNVCVALGNIGDPVAVPALARALTGPDGSVRAHAAWALGRIGGAAAIGALRSARARERDTGVIDEIEAALADCAG